MSEFLHMGGYAFYVWTSYGIAFLLLVLNVIWPLMQKREYLRKIRRRIQREKQS